MFSNTSLKRCNSLSYYINLGSYDGNGSWATQFSLNTKTGNVGIGTTVPDAKLTVKGQVHVKEVKVDLNVQGPDYIFEPSYSLPSLDSVQSYIN